MALQLVVATEALKRRKVAELEMERLQGTKFQLETQVTTLESASFNAETMAAMKKAAGALKDIHKGLYVFRLYVVFVSVLTAEYCRASGQSRMWTRL